MWPNAQFPADLVTFTGEILNGKLHFLCSAQTCMGQYHQDQVLHSKQVVLVLVTFEWTVGPTKLFLKDFNFDVVILDRNTVNQIKKKKKLKERHSNDVIDLTQMSILNLFSRFADDIEYMTGSRPNLFWMVCWKYVSPVALIVILISSFYNIIKETPQYELYVGCPQQLVSSVFSHRSYFILSDSQCKPFVVYLYFSFYASYPNCNVVKE